MIDFTPFLRRLSPNQLAAIRSEIALLLPTPESNLARAKALVSIATVDDTEHLNESKCNQCDMQPHCTTLYGPCGTRCPVYPKVYKLPMDTSTISGGILWAKANETFENHDCTLESVYWEECAWRFNYHTPSSPRYMLLTYNLCNGPEHLLLEQITRFLENQP